jgi:hypothetical protein
MGSCLQRLAYGQLNNPKNHENLIFKNVQVTVIKMLNISLP